jgi:hypothetical protein
MELSPHPNDIRVRLIDMTVPWQTPSPIVKDAFLTELVIRDKVRPLARFHLLQHVNVTHHTIQCEGSS